MRINSKYVKKSEVEYIIRRIGECINMGHDDHLMGQLGTLLLLGLIDRKTYDELMYQVLDNKQGDKNA